MSDETGTFALKNTLNEIKNAYPTITNAFIFKNAKTLATDENTDKTTIHSAVDAFNAIIKRANAVDGIETLTIHSTNGKANITHINNLYLATITSEETDEKHVNTLTQVLVPIVLKLVVKIHPASLSEDIFALEEPEPAELSMEENTTTEPEPDALLPKPPVNQFIIDNLNGILAPQDTVRIDKAIIAQWKKLYPNKKIEKVDAETLNGKTTRCKFKPIKDSKNEGKGTIQIPEKIQLTLHTTKGELVMVKPVVK
jgi:hypothetical protein